MSIRSVGAFAGVLALAVLGWATPSGAAGPVVRTSSSLAPSFVTIDREALYAASWTNDSTPTLTNTSITVTLPPGSTLLSADPAVCAAATPASLADPVVVSCPRANLHSGETFSQQLYVRLSQLTAGFDVTAFLQGDERASDPNKSHTDTFPAPPRSIAVISAASDAAGACTQVGLPAVATQPGASATNRLVTTAALTGATGLFCTPVTLVERHRTDPTEGCGAGDTCTVDLSVTEAPEVATPIRLGFTFLSTNKNLTWYKNGVAVADCSGATQLPAGLDACVSSRAKQGSGVVSLGVLWRGGPDPTWTGH
jgi:hypothetical protein